MQNLPLDLVVHLLLILGVPSLSSASCVNKSWREIASSDEVWRQLYQQRFVQRPVQMKRSSSSRRRRTLELSFATPESAREVLPHRELPFPRPRVVIRRIAGLVPETPRSPRSFKARFRQRLESPIVGDEVEVSWHGKFRLESCEVHAGCAWWAASIVDKLKLHDEDKEKWWYKVTFPGWQGRWDEWVPRERLRWPTPRMINGKNKKVFFYQPVIKPRDFVEVWCSSKNVPGAWFEARVIKVKHNINKFLISSAEQAAANSEHSPPVWIDGSRIRMSRKKIEPHRPVQNNILAKIGLCSPRRSLSNNTMPSFVNRGFVEANEPVEDIDLY